MYLNQKNGFEEKKTLGASPDEQISTPTITRHPTKTTFDNYFTMRRYEWLRTQHVIVGFFPRVRNPTASLRINVAKTHYF